MARKPLLPGSAKGFWHAFNGVTIAGDIHTGYTWNLSYPSTQLLVAGCDDKAFPLLYHVNNAVISVASLAVAGNSLKSRVLGKTQSNLVFTTQLFQFAHDTIRDTGDAFCQQAIHHGSDHLQFLPDGKIDKVGVN